MKYELEWNNGSFSGPLTEEKMKSCIKYWADKGDEPKKLHVLCQDLVDERECLETEIAEQRMGC